MEEGIFPVLIVFGAFIFAGTMRWMKYKAEALKLQTADKAVYKELEALRNRVQVLERIVTDKRERLKQEIDAL